MIETIWIFYNVYPDYQSWNVEVILEDGRVFSKRQVPERLISKIYRWVRENSAKSTFARIAIDAVHTHIALKYSVGGYPC